MGHNFNRLSSQWLNQFWSLLWQTAVALVAFVVILVLTRGNPLGLTIAVVFCLVVVLIVGLEMSRQQLITLKERDQHGNESRRQAINWLRNLITDISAHSQKQLIKNLDGQPSADGGDTNEPPQIQPQKKLTRPDLKPNGYYVGADLRHLNLKGIDLHGAVLIHANLEGVNLQGANVKGADLGGANLSHANLTEAILERTDMSGAILSKAILRSAQLNNAVLRVINLQQADLTAANLQGSDLSRADLRQAIFCHANLSQISVIDAQLQEANLSSAILSGADLSGSDLSQANLASAQLRGTILRRCILVEANLNHSQLASVSLRGSNLENATLQRSNLSHANLSFTNLSGINFSKADLTEVNFSGANLSKANLSQANLSGARMVFVDLTAANLQGATLLRVNLSDANLQGATLVNARLNRAYLSNINFMGANLTGADLIGTNLLRANFQRANLQNIVLRRSYMSDANLQETNLCGADLSGADLSGVQLEAAQVIGTKFWENLGFSEEIRLDLQNRGASVISCSPRFNTSNRHELSPEEVLAEKSRRADEIRGDLNDRYLDIEENLQNWHELLNLLKTDLIAWGNRGDLATIRVLNKYDLIHKATCNLKEICTQFQTTVPASKAELFSAFEPMTHDELTNWIMTEFPTELDNLHDQIIKLKFYRQITHSLWIKLHKLR